MLQDIELITVCFEILSNSTILRSLVQVYIDTCTPTVVAIAWRIIYRALRLLLIICEMGLFDDVVIATIVI